MSGSVSDVKIALKAELRRHLDDQIKALEDGTLATGDAKYREGLSYREGLLYALRACREYGLQ